MEKRRVGFWPHNLPSHIKELMPWNTTGVFRLQIKKFWGGLSLCISAIKACKEPNCHSIFFFFFLKAWFRFAFPWKTQLHVGNLLGEHLGASACIWNNLQTSPMSALWVPPLFPGLTVNPVAADESILYATLKYKPVLLLLLEAASTVITDCSWKECAILFTHGLS